MQASVVPASAFTERGSIFGRLDPEFVQHDKLALEKRLREMSGGKPLSSFMLKSIENYSCPDATESVSVEYVAIDNIDAQDGFLFHQTVSLEELPSRAKYILKPYDIVISNVRPERGAVGIVLEAQDGAVGSSGLTVIRVEPETPRNVLFAYLRSRFARSQLIRRSRGSMYPAITKDDVPEVIVPEFSLEKMESISSKVRESLKHRQTFFDLVAKQLADVETYLTETLGTAPPDIVLDVAPELPVRIARWSELFGETAKRFDAEFHRREFVEFESRLKKLPNVIRLGQEYEAFAGGNPGKGNQTVARLRQAQLSGFGISITGCEEVENAKAPVKITLCDGDVLIGCTAHEPHYVGNRVDLVDDLAGATTLDIVPVPDVMIIRARNATARPHPAFVASFLRTRWGRRQFQRLNRGLRGGHVYGQDVESFIYVPCPSKEWMDGFSFRQSAIRGARRESIVAMAEAVALIEAELNPKALSASG